MENDKTVLLIEDEPRWQRELRRILEKGGYQVEVADNYDEAAAALNVRAANVAVVDVSLIPEDAHDRQGFALMVEAGMPVVCVSGYLDPDEVGKLHREGLADWFFAKQSFAGKEEAFLEAIGLSLLKSEQENHERWRAIKRRFRLGD